MSTTPTPESAPPSGSALKPPEISSTPEERQLAFLCHLGGAFLSILVPLIIWLLKKDQSRFVEDQAKEALNFQITLLIGHFVAGLTICFTLGVVNGGLYVVGLVFGILAAVAANKGEVYRYPFAIRLIK
jgi:uncharacterized Tic20 family protein